MILTILQLTIPLLGFYSLHQIFSDKIEKKRVIKGLKLALGITGGFCLLFALLPSLAGSFTSPADSQFPDWLQQALPEDRQSMLRSDAFRYKYSPDHTLEILQVLYEKNKIILVHNPSRTTYHLRYVECRQTVSK